MSSMFESSADTDELDVLRAQAKIAWDVVCWESKKWFEISLEHVREDSCPLQAAARTEAVTCVLFKWSTEIVTE